MGVSLATMAMQAARARITSVQYKLDAEERKEERSEYETPAEDEVVSNKVEDFLADDDRGFHFHSVFGSDDALSKYVGEFGGLKFVVDAKLVMYGDSKKFTYASYEHGNAMGDSIGHFDRLILKGTFEKVKFNRYNFICEELASHRTARTATSAIFSGQVILSSEHGVSSDQMILSFPSNFPAKATTMGPWSFWAHDRIAKMDAVSPAEFMNWGLERCDADQTFSLDGR